MPRRPKADKLRRLARELFGFKKLRPEQEEAILSVLKGRDTLAVMPTGSGKSAIYQLAALMIRPGAIEKARGLAARDDPQLRRNEGLPPELSPQLLRRGL